MVKKNPNLSRIRKEKATPKQAKKDDLPNNLFLSVWADKEFVKDGEQIRQKYPVREFRFTRIAGARETIGLDVLFYDNERSTEPTRKVSYLRKQDFETLKGNRKILNIRQVAFYPQAAKTPIFIIDSVADVDSTIECKETDPAKLEFAFELKLPFLFSGIQLGFKLKANIGHDGIVGVGCDNFELWPSVVTSMPFAKTSIIDKKDNWILAQTVKDDLDKKFQIDFNFLNRYPVNAQFPNPFNGGDFLTEIGFHKLTPTPIFGQIYVTLAGKLTGDNAKLADAAAYAPACRVKFIRNEISDIFDVVKLIGLGDEKGFKSQDPRESEKETKRRISLFEKTINIESDAADYLDFVQYPQNPVSLNATALRKASEFLMVIKNVPSRHLHDYWNEEIADTYYAQSAEVSYVPKFASAPQAVAQAPWNLAYLVKYNLLDKKHDFDFKNQIDPSAFSVEPAFNKGLIKWQAFTPQTNYTVKVVFDRLKTHENKGLIASNLLLQAPKQAGPFYRFGDYEAFKLVFDGPILCDPDQKVRLGAFDLSFGGAINPADKGEVFYRATVLEKNEIKIVAQDLKFVVKEVNPGGQDDLLLAGFAEPKQITVMSKPCALPTDEEQVRNQLNSVSSNIRAVYKDYETRLEARFRREKPLVLSLRDIEPSRNTNPITTTYSLVVDETKLDMKERTIRLSLISNGKEDNQDLKAVILDREPFLVAKVQFPFNAVAKAFGRKEMATWSNASGDGRRWKLNTEAQPFELILPPQAVGEEMEKSRTIKEGKRADFRLGTPARITLAPSKYTPFKDVGKALQNYTEPPWNLRRLLGDATQSDPGLFIQHMQIELLYGLSCDINYPFLRIAEIGSLVGRIPGRLSIPDNIINNASEADVKAYLLARFDWAVVNRRFLSRIGMLIPWNTRPPLISGKTEEAQKKEENAKKTRPVFLINEQARCYIRQAPQGYQPPPVQPGEEPPQLPAEMENPIEPDNDLLTLRGGATWGFESKNVYDAVMRSEPNKDKKDGFPASEEGKAGDEKNKTDATVLSDLALSSYGGWGKVAAPFDKKRSKISADVAMGRTLSYEVERIGRIGVFWNRAKHVIVYERTVVPTKQMAPLQNALVGRTVVRKVREYIEILQAERSYPDFPSGGAPMAVEGAFVKGCKFVKGQKINVLSAWGVDVETRGSAGNLVTQGWKVPLWDPTAEPHLRSDGTTPIPENELVYPLPKVCLNLEVRSANADKEKAVGTHECQIAKPQNLFFYTSTMPDEDENTDKWRPVKNVDYVNLPMAKPCNDFRVAAVQTTPHDPPENPGDNPVTFELVANLPAVNIVAGKGVEPLSAVLRTVTMMRAEYIPEAELVKNPARNVVDNLAGLRNALINDFQTLLEKIPADLKDAENDLKRIRKAIGDEAAKLNTLQQDGIAKYLGPVVDTFKNNFQEVKNKIDTAGNIAFSKAVRTLTEFKEAGDDSKNGILVQINRGYKEILDKPVTNIDAVRARLEGYVRLLHEGLIMTEVSPAVLFKPLKETLDHYQTAVQNVQNDINRRVQVVTANIDQAKKIVEGDLDELRAFLDSIDELIAETKRIRVRVPQDWIPDMFGAIWQKYFGDFDEERAGLKKRLDAAVDGIGKLIDKPLSSAQIQQLQKDIGDKVNKPINDLLKLKLNLPTDHELNQVIKRFQATQNDLTGLVESWIEKQELKVKSITEANVKAVTAELREFVRIPDNLGTANLEEAIKAINPGADHLFAKYKSIADNLKTVEQSTISSIFGPATNAIEHGVTELEVLKKKLLNQVNEITKDVRAEVEGLRDQLLNQAHGFISNNIHAIPLPPSDVVNYVNAQAGNAVRLVRAFGEPPKVPNLTFDRPSVAYFYDKTKEVVDITPILSRVEQVNDILEAAKPFGIALPSTSVLERLIPPEFDHLDLSSILPNFAGMDLKDLFSGVKMPKLGSDKIKISHGFDRQAERAWVKANVDLPLSGRKKVFAIGPVELILNSAIFTAEMKLEGGISQPAQKSVNGKIFGDWEIMVGGTTVLIIKDTSLTFDQGGHFKFNIKVSNVKLPSLLSFVSEILESFTADGGLTFRITPELVEATLELPVPPIMAGVSGISNLHFSVAFRLFFDPFAIEVAFRLGGKIKPFNVTSFILSGGGYIELAAKYVPELKSISCYVEIGIAMGARVGVAFGPINGMAYVYYGTYIRYTVAPKEPNRAGLRIGITYLVGGEVTLLGFVRVSINLLLDASYEQGKLTGRGTLSVKVKICWCFTLEIEESVEYTVGSGTKRTSRTETSGPGIGGMAMTRRNRNGNVMFINAGYQRENRALQTPEPPKVIERDAFIKLVGDFVDLLS